MINKAQLLSCILAGSVASVAHGNLFLTGVFDGDLSGGLPKGVELYASADIADLSAYAIGSANNGGGSDGEEFTFPAVSVSAGDFIYVASEETGFNTYFGFNPDYTSNAMAINGDDAIELFQGGSVIDVFGDINAQGGAWDYADGWAYRIDGTGPDGSTFVEASWLYGNGEFDGFSSNAEATNSMPIGTYAVPEPSTYAALLGALALGFVAFRRRRA